MKQKIVERAHQLGLKKREGQLDFTANNPIGLWNPPSQAIASTLILLSQSTQIHHLLHRRMMSASSRCTAKAWLRYVLEGTGLYP